MMTLREFVMKVNFREHFRVYMPNRDCLIYESYFKVHSPYYFDEVHKDDWYKDTYFTNNDYCDNVYMGIIDEETQVLLDEFGEYEVQYMECSNFSPRKIYTDENGKLCFESCIDPSYPNQKILNCFNLFIK